MPPRFLQIHFLTRYPAALLNRDDAGFAKRLPYGGVVRTRVSSQAQKRRWRTHDGQHALSEIGVDMAVRSRRTFQEHIYEPLVEEDGVDREAARELTVALIDAVLGKSVRRAGEEEDGTLETGQVTVLGPAEVRYLRELAAEAYASSQEEDAPSPTEVLEARLKEREVKLNLKALARAAGFGLDAALHGRMVTSDKLAQVDAAVHVAHAFTVHGESAEADYFTAVDDLAAAAGELGSGHLNTSELTSGLYYGYVVIDVPTLVSNLEGCDPEDWQAADRQLTTRVVEHFLHTVAKVSIGAKKGSTAPYAHADLMMVEAGDDQPRSLAGAFEAPVPEQPDLRANAFEALGREVRDHEQVYGTSLERRVVALGPREALDLADHLADDFDGLVDWAVEQIGRDDG